MKWTTSWAIAVSKASSSNGSSSAAECSTVDVRLPLPESGNEGLGRVDGGDAGGSDALDEHGRERAGSRAHVQHALSRLDAREVREERGERGRVPPHEPVVRLGCDGEAHRGGLYSRTEPRLYAAPQCESPCSLSSLVLGFVPGAFARDATTSLTLEQQVGQLVVMSFRGTKAPAYVLDALRAKRSAGVILFGANVVSPDQVRALTLSLRRAGGRPLVAVDQEGGRVRRVPWVGPVLAEPQQAASGTVRSGAAAAARELRALGITVNLAPVADVPSVRSAAIATRAFSHDPAVASASVRAAVRGWRAGGVAATAKHFPGIGAAVENTDDAVVRILRSRAELERVDLAPFRAAVTAGVPLVMVGHARYPALDRFRIASQSEPIIDGAPPRRARLRRRRRDGLARGSGLALDGLARRRWRSAAVRAGADLLLLTGRGSYRPGVRPPAGGCADRSGVPGTAFASPPRACSS